MALLGKVLKQYLSDMHKIAGNVAFWEKRTFSSV